jgi:hypothetical protein
MKPKSTPASFANLTHVPSFHEWLRSESVPLSVAVAPDNDDGRVLLLFGSHREGEEFLKKLAVKFSEYLRARST